MAEIATYQCTNLKCRFSVRVSRDFPVWHPETPRALQTLAITPEARPFVVRYRTELFCHNCRKINEHQGTLICAFCSASDLREEQLGKPCAQCPIGVFEMTKLIVY